MSEAPPEALTARQLNRTTLLRQSLPERSDEGAVMRGTLHVVAAGDYPAFSLASSAARIANWRPSASRVGVETAIHH